MFSQLRHKLPAKVSRIPSKIRYANFHPTSSNAVVSGIDKHVASLAILVERGEIERFLFRLSELVSKLLLFEPMKGRALYVPELDELARKASLMVAPDGNPPTNSKLLLHVATEVYPTGGHSRVIEDIVSALPEYRHVLVITGMHKSHPTLAILKSRYNQLNLKVHLLQCWSRSERARELSSLIGLLGPDAVLLLTHPHDSIANAGIAGHAARRVLFFHHADHQPSLGASRRDYVHVDLTPECHAICRSDSRPQASLLNLTVKDIGTLKVTERPSAIGATCGSPHKYLGSSEFSYAQLLEALFSSGINRVFHIGDMPASQKDQIRAEIAASGQDAGRIVFLPNTPALTVKLLELSPDFYFTSHPIGSGKATVEALSVGLPILFLCAASTPPLLRPDMTFGTSVPVSSLGQIPAAICRLQTEKRMLAKRSRAIYEKHYSPSAFRDGLLAAISGN
ncbi:MAG: glycosyltransferase [Terriglobales bacterium]